MREAYAHCEAEVRVADKDRYLATLFAPADARPHLFALYAFNAEVARSRERAREPLAGEVRLEWWRETLAGEGRGEVAQNPVAAALLDTAERFGLPRAELNGLIDARRFDLYDEPMETLAALEAYGRATSSSLFSLAAKVLAGNAPVEEAADHAGLTYAFTGLLRAVPVHATRGQLYLPLDVLRRNDASREDVISGRFTPGLGRALAELRAHARRRLKSARARLAEVPRATMPAFLPLALIEPYLARMERSDYHPFRTPVELPQWRRQWTLWRASHASP